MASYSRGELAGYRPPPFWVEGTDEFRAWYVAQPHDLKDAIDAAVGLLEQLGPALGRPQADTLSHTKGYRVRHTNLKELRITYRGDAYRVFFAFDPRRICILLLGGRKPNEKWYQQVLPAADKLYEHYLAELRGEGWSV